MNDVSQPLSEQEFELLDELLIKCCGVKEDMDTTGLEEGIFDISSLDGFFTAIISGPIAISPSQWFPSLWGDFEPVFESDEEFQQIFALMVRYYNGIADELLYELESYEPVFMENNHNGKTVIVVDEWCFGYMMGMALTESKWDLSGMDMSILLAPIKAFGTEDGWTELDEMNTEERDNIRSAIVPNVKEIYSHWLARRDEQEEGLNEPFQHTEPQVGRNDPCPCGSGKKYKKCCLH